MFRKAFIFEDCWTTRRDILTRGFPVDTDFCVASTWNDAISLLEKDWQSFDLFMLDHDISHINPECKSENHDAEWGICPDCVVIDKSGHDLAKLIVQLGIGKGKIFLIHSDNPSGRDNISHTLNCGNRIVVPCGVREIRVTIPNLFTVLSQLKV